MCVSTLFIDRYADGEEIVQKEEWRRCPYGPTGRPWDCHEHYEDEVENLVRNVPDSIMSSRSSESSSRVPSSRAPSIIDSRDRSPRSRRHSRREAMPVTGLFLDAFFGERKRSTRRSESRTRTSTTVIEDRIPRVYPAIPSPTFRTSYESAHRFSPSPMSPASPLTPRFSESWEGAVIIDASPLNRGRRGTPIIHDDGRRPRRSDSTEVHAAPSRARTPSPNLYDVRRREEQRVAEEERRRQRRQRDLRAAELAHDIAEGRSHQRRRRETELHDAEINARPPRPVVEQNSPPVAHGILRNQSVRRPRERDSVIEDLNMSERGEQVLREAIAARERERADAEMRRLGRRFERVVYRDDPYRR